MTDTITEAAVAALAEGLHQSGYNEMCANLTLNELTHNKGSPCDSCMQAAGVIFRRYTPEARGKVLLGFTVAELGKKANGDTLAWLIAVRNIAGNVLEGSGPTPLAAVTAALDAL